MTLLVSTRAGGQLGAFVCTVFLSEDTASFLAAGSVFIFISLSVRISSGEERGRRDENVDPVASIFLSREVKR